MEGFWRSAMLATAGWQDFSVGVYSLSLWLKNLLSEAGAPFHPWMGQRLVEGQIVVEFT